MKSGIASRSNVASCGILLFTPAERVFFDSIQAKVDFFPLPKL